MPHDRPSDGPTIPSPGGAPGERKLAPDLARGFMLLLIAMAYAGVYAGGGFGVDLTGEPLPDRLAGFLATLLLDNRAFPMFAILFGYGLGWMVARQTGRGAEPADVRRLLRRRGLFLLLFGAVHAFLVFPGEILTSYGLATLVTGWLLFRSNRVMVRAAWILAGLYACTVPAVMLGMAYAQSRGNVSQEAIPGYTSAADWVERAVGLPFGPLFIAFGYPLLLLVVLGYRAGRSGLLDDPHAHRAALTRIAVVGIAVSLVGALPAGLIAVGVLQPDTVPAGLLLALQVLTGVCGGAGYVALFGLLSIRLDPRHSPATRAIGAVGKRSLTFYIANSALVAVVLHRDLGGVGEQVGMLGALVIAACVWLVGLGAAAALERAGRPGPLDALLRRLVYRGHASARGGASGGA